MSRKKVVKTYGGIRGSTKCLKTPGTVQTVTSIAYAKVTPETVLPMKKRFEKNTNKARKN